MLSLSTIKKSKASSQNRKRIGRGNSSGTGTYSGKGLKGQNSRSGVSGLKRKGMKQVLLRTPKKRGFKSYKPDNQVVNLSLVSATFKDGDKINPETLFEKKLIKTLKRPVKILGNGELSLKDVHFKGVKMSETVKEKIGKSKGKVA